MRSLVPSDLANRLTLFFLLCTLIPFTLLGAFVYRQARAQILAQATAQLTGVATLKAQSVSLWVEEHAQSVDEMRLSPLWQNYLAGGIDNADATAYLERLAGSHKDADQIFLMDASTGQILASSDRTQLGQIMINHPYFQQGRAGLYVQGVYWPPSMERMVMTISAPVRGGDGQVRQVLAMHLNLAGLATIMAEDSGFGETGRTYLVNRAHFPLSETEMQEGFTFRQGIYTDGVEQALAGNTGTRRYTGYEGRPVIGAYYWLPDLQLALIAEADEQDVLGRLGAFTLLLLVALGLTLIGANLALYLITRRLMAPIGQLTGAAQHVASGSLDVQVPPPPRGGQIEGLVNTFNAMLGDLRETRAREEQHALELDRTNRQLAALLETSRAISSELDLDALLNRILEQTVALIPDADQASLALWDGQAFVPRAVIGDDEEALAARKAVVLRSLDEWDPALAPAAKVLAQGQSYCLAAEQGPDRQLFPPQLQERLAKLGFGNAQTLLIVPVVVHGQTGGLISLANLRSPLAFGDEDRQTAGLLATQAATAIANAQLYNESQREKEHFRLLNEASLDVTASLNLTEVLRATLRRARDATGSEHGGIFVLDEEGNLQRHLTVHHDYYGETLNQALIARVYPVGLAGWVVRQKQPALVNDTTTDVRWVPLKGDAPDPTLRSSLIVPLLHKGQVLGGLSLGDTRTGQFRHEHLELLTGLAAQAAAAIANARLFAKIEASRRDWEITFDTIADGIVIVDMDGFVLQTNHAFARLLDMHPRELIGRHLPPLIFAAGAPPEECPTLRTLMTGEASQGELSGEPTLIPGTFFISAYPRHNEAGEVVGVVSIWRDVTAERDVQARARWLEELNRRIIENASDLIYAHDLEGNFIFINPRAVGLVGYALEEASRLNIRDLVAPEYLEREIGHIRAPRGTVVPPHEVIVIKKDGGRVPLEISASPLIEHGRVVGVVGVARDLREIRRLERRLLQAEKLSSLGQLVAGVAHELNNPLTAVIGFAQLLQNAGVDEQTRETLQRIDAQAQRAAQIVRNLLAFARQQEPHRETLDINKVIEETLKLVEYEWKTQNLEVETHLASPLPWIIADRRQLQQVFLNLFQNAHQAMASAHGRGALTIRTGVVGIPEGRFVHIEVHDNGPGMTAETLARVFDPFFTTKEVGEGTGLGLSICYGIVQEQGGAIWADSVPGEGSTFYLEWPVEETLAISESPSPDHETVAFPPHLPVPAHILVVEDEEMLAEMLTKVLTDHGHQVAAASEGKEALERLGQRSFDFIISDIKMPGMDGKAFYKELKVHYPALADRLIFITGDTVSPDTTVFLDEADVPVLEKPFLTADLLTALRRLQ